MSLDLRKPDFVVCEQQRHRSACAYVQSDQHLCYSLSCFMKISLFQLVSVAEQAGVNLTWLETLKTGLLLSRSI